MSSFAIGPRCLAVIHDLAPSGSAILELGSGSGTAFLARSYCVTSVEHDTRWLGLADSDYIYAPIVNGWYDVAVLRNKLPTDYALLLIDGPTGTIGRLGFLLNLDLFNLAVPLVVDDINRPDELKLYRSLLIETGRPGAVLNEGDGRQVGVIP